MTDWGVHLLDIALWGTGKTVPKSVMSMGGAHAFPGSIMEAPDTQHVLYDFGDLTITWEHTFRASNLGAPFGRHHGVAFYGENGLIVADRGGWELIPEVDDSNPKLKKYKLEMLPKQTPVGDDRDLHAANFIECIKTRQPTVCPIEAGAHIARVAQLGNMSQRLGRQLICDASGLPQGADAQALAKAKYRAPYILPV
jgi:predicted dehydrogenase